MTHQSFGRTLILGVFALVLGLSGCVKPVPDPARRVLNSPPMFKPSAPQTSQAVYPRVSQGAQVWSQQAQMAQTPGVSSAPPSAAWTQAANQPALMQRLFARRGLPIIEFTHDEILKQAALIAEINKIRRQFGKETLIDNEILTQTAAAYARQLAQRHRLDHKDAQGRGPDGRVEERGYQWKYVAENLAAGQLTPAEVVQDWLDSPPHRAALLSDHPEQLGVAYLRSKLSLREDPHLTYWVALFAKPQMGG